MSTTTLPPVHPPEVRTLDPAEPADFALPPYRVDLWLVRRPPAADTGILTHSELDERERKQAAAFIRRSDGLLYAAAHVALRRLLGAYTRTEPGRVEFMREPCPGCGEAHGRPAVAPPPPPVHFSLSHSGGVALVGVATRPIGVDVEKLPGAETVDICSQALHPDEQAELAEAAGDERRDLFGRIWTRKEAYLKGLGTGLSRSPAEDYLGADTSRHPDGWTMIALPCPPTHAASAVVLGEPPALALVRQMPHDWLAEGWSGPGPGPGDRLL
jgi:4'-phosphopantetheinyl transferase